MKNYIMLLLLYVGLHVIVLQSQRLFKKNDVVDCLNMHRRIKLQIHWFISAATVYASLFVVKDICTLFTQQSIHMKRIKVASH
jgi:hypothetical protein